MFLCVFERTQSFQCVCVCPRPILSQQGGDMKAFLQSLVIAKTSVLPKQHKRQQAHQDTVEFTHTYCTDVHKPLGQLANQ